MVKARISTLQFHTIDAPASLMQGEKNINHSWKEKRILMKVFVYLNSFGKCCVILARQTVI